MTARCFTAAALVVAILAGFIAGPTNAQGAVDVPTMEQHNALESRVEALELLHAPPPVSGSSILTCKSGPLAFPTGQLPGSFSLDLHCTRTTAQEPGEMATLTHAASTADSDNSSSYASDAFTPAADDLLVVFVSATGTVLASPTLTSSVSGKTFSLAGSAAFNSDSHTLYAFIADQLASAESQTLTFDCTGDASIGAIIHVERVAGVTKTGLAALAQAIGTAENADGTLDTNVTFGSAVQTGNPTIGGSGASVTTEATEPTDWTDLGSVSHSAPGHRAQTVGRESGFTGTTITWPAIGGTSNRAIIFLEIDTSGGGGGSASNHRPLMMTGMG